MGLFDRLFGKKEKTEKVLPTSEEVTENKEQEVADTEEPKAVSQDRDEQKISDMEAYYQELKERIAATHQPVSTVTQEESSEEPLVEEKESVEASEDQAPVEEITEVAIPAEPVEEITEVAIPAESAEEIAEVEAPAEPVEEIAEVETPAEPSEEFVEVEAPAEPAEEITAVEIPAEPAEEITEEAAPAEPAEEITEVAIPAESAEEITEEAAPAEPVEAPDQEAQSEVAPQQETIQEKYDRSLKKTRTGFGARLNAFFANFRSVDEEFFEELEELLIMSDVGVQVASNLTEELRYEARLENAKKPDALKRVIIEKLVDLYEKDGQFNEAIQFQEDLTVMLFVGVNGVGKTTSIGKLAHKYKQEGKKVMLVAADTFRAGAVAQLAEWGRRVDVPVVTGPEKSDPASVVFDGMERAIAENVDILMIDTAGRLQNKDNLMAELEKIGRIIKRVVPEAPHETLLALDASTGQNALVQAKEFSKITPVTGIVLTKIDGTARGGVVLAIREELDIPVKLIGFGEKIDDIGPFNSENFMRGLLEGLI
ncbi:Signal recognition particle receptor FtsY [Streptococcus parasanguinis]|uniref:signal recognition particle-docking protein FtsY n=1 Tax=Streptococcus parasanguinis TaxID=1318 RepID=UPI0019609A02|nr:signal recognition particle-docking protein FtsY [Streptococcus parasanguinis]VTY28667.1 Signal recognition particle receptor FtsY [Streptococcus parasanguinis]